MIRRSFEKYVFEMSAVNDAIFSVLGRVPLTWEGKILTLDADVSGPQLAALKAAIMPLLSTVQDFNS